jgi:hypothetical protein
VVAVGEPDAQADSATASRTKAIDADTVGRMLGDAGSLAVDPVSQLSGVEPLVVASIAGMLACPVRGCVSLYQRRSRSDLMTGSR